MSISIVHDPTDTNQKPTKKNSTAGTVTTATPSSEAENPPPTPTPSTPITPVHPNSFNGQKGEGQNATAVPQGPATSAPAVEQPQPDANAMDGFAPEGGDVSSLSVCHLLPCAHESFHPTLMSMADQAPTDAGCLRHDVWKLQQRQPP